MEQSDIANLNRIANYLKVSAGKIGINKEKIVCRLVQNKTLCGYSTIVSAMGRESKQDSFAQSDPLTQSLITQWFDYSVLFVDPAHDSTTSTDLVLQELNDYFLEHSYLVGQNITLADVVLFYSIFNVMNSLSPAAKGKFVNVSRWYDHLQKNKAIRQNLPLINLSNAHLHGWATGTHI